jgi:nicotinamidase/pyrazinamidase
MTKLPKRAKVAAFDVDAQNTFTPVCPSELPVPEGDSIIPELNAQAGFAGYRLGSKDAHPDNAVWRTDDPNEIGAPLHGYANAREKWVPHALVGTHGFELLDGLPRVSEYDYFVYKGAERDMHPYGACYHDVAETVSTGAIEFLCYRGVTTIILGGLATDFCVRATVAQLADAGLEVLVNTRAVRGISDAGCEASLAEMRRAGVRLFDGAQALQQHKG